MQTSLARWLIPKSLDNGQAEHDNVANHASTSPPCQQASTENDAPAQPIPPDRASHQADKPCLDPEQSPSLHPNITLEHCTPATLPAFKRLNALFPIPYPARFYDEILSDPVVDAITLLAVWNEPSAAGQSKVIAGIRCRLLPCNNPQLGQPAATTATASSSVLYISTLIVSPPFRTAGVATSLLRAVTRAGIGLGADRVRAHVWVANGVGREWYSARGFGEVGVEEGYYRRLEPRGAVVVERRIGVLEHLACGTSLCGTKASDGEDTTHDD